MSIWAAEIFGHLNICALVRARVTGACRFIWQAPLQSYLLPTWAAPSSLLVFTKSWRLSCWRCLEKIFCSFDLNINFSPTSKLFQSLSLNNYTLSSMHDPLKSIDIRLRQSYTGHVSAKGLKNSHCSDGLFCSDGKFSETQPPDTFHQVRDATYQHFTENIRLQGLTRNSSQGVCNNLVGQ